MPLSVLKTARRVKLPAFATPFHGQGDVWFPRAEVEGARESVARIESEAKKAKVLVTMIFVAAQVCLSELNRGKKKSI